MFSGLFIIFRFFFLGDGRILLSRESGRDDFVLIIWWRDVVPRVLSPDVGLVCEESCAY